MAKALSSADFPGYAEAVSRERIVRAAACLGITEKILGLDVLALTSRHVRWLAFVNSPFMLRDVPLDGLCFKPGIVADILIFLWIVSPHYRPGGLRARNRFYKNVGKIIRKMPVNEVVKEITDYIDEAYLDAGKPAGEERSYYAFEVSIVTALHRTYGLPIDFWETGWLRNLVRRITGKPSPLDVPLKIFWQLQKAERRYQDPDCPLSNSSCKFISDGLTKMNETSKRMAEYVAELRKTECVASEPTRIDLDGSEYGLN